MIKKKEPSWLFHCHYGPKRLPLTVYDNHDGTFTYMDDDFTRSNGSAEIALRLLAGKMNELLLSKIKTYS